MILRTQLAIGLLLPTLSVLCPSAMAQLRVGAAKIDVTPQQLPVLVNGSMVAKTTDTITTRINARAIVIDDGSLRIAMVVVDSCLMPRELLDQAKQLASSRTGLLPENIMISATHTHTAPSVMGALGTPPDENYRPYLRQRIADAIEQAESRMVPAEVGWASGDAAQFTALRRWVRRPDRIEVDPFGNRTVRANMHSARNLDDVVGPSGPEDPALSMICFRDAEQKPIAVLANFSMHYFGHQNISADYFGMFCDGLESHLQEDHPDSQSLAIMSHGCSGDIWRRDYMQPQTVAEGTIESYTDALLGVAKKIYASTNYKSAKSIGMRERRLSLKYRTPDAQRLQWAQGVVEQLDGELPKTRPEIYAREQVFLHEMQQTDVVVQAIRIGDIAIATTPTETYALTGLKLKLRSPLEKTMVIELANGGDGYIPPPEQHRLGGYNTWAARSAGLEISAEPKIVAAGLDLLSDACDLPTRQPKQSIGPTAQAILASKPSAYWQLDELDSMTAHDRSRHGRTAIIEPGTLYFLPGDDRHFTNNEENRSLHFVHSRLRYQHPEPLQSATTIFSFWNGMPGGSRPVLGWLFSLDQPGGSSEGLHVGVTDTTTGPRLALQVGDKIVAQGSATIKRWNWHQIAVCLKETGVTIYLDGASGPDITWTGQWQPKLAPAARVPELFWAGRSDLQDSWEGRIDEVVLFDRELQPNELTPLFAQPANSGSGSNSDRGEHCCSSD
ncbi:MAG: hypothetical protein Aurels2KO_05290 [Aureliella sp.]